MDYIKEYTDWLYNNITQTSINDNLIEITTPFLDRHNDYTQVYIKTKNGVPAQVSDMGYTINDLLMSGFEFNSNKRKELMNIIINRNGVMLNNGVLFVKVNSLKELPEAKHKLLQTIISINDMFVLNRSNISNIFFEEVNAFFEKNNIIFTENISFIGKSRLQNSYDYVLPRTSNNPERIIDVVNSLDINKSKQIIFSWNDIVSTRKKGTLNIVIINDENKINEDSLNALKEYGIYPILWSLIKKEINILK
ncbi:DUF1829 domain-containing protein [Helcococcus ovis]|uniref:DUF1829 domain-containing protein n=1 Tax=Helcococcus ovis TaxID=72026 RepID=UPI00106F3259|nr:DUF1829 domain-containing protein [Helcococcus ovis]TFF68328.1 DUF1829 domain-containing protein [Helcococcus ovis]WNZ00921.1 DUF1829 domain-containing protein [Helcococcus ovis]